MDKLLLQLKNKRERTILHSWLEKDYEILPRDPDRPLDQPFDLAIIDGPSFKRLRAQVRARRRAQESVLLPFLLVTVRRRGAKPARHLGLVDDVIVRPLDQDELVGRVCNLLRLRRLSLELKKEHDRVMRLSVTDDVSGFYNTRYLHRYLDRLLASTHSRQDAVSLVFFDLDNFKQVVDTHGHPLGAKTLKEVAQAAASVLNEEDRLVRYGGDEFVVILPRQSKHAALIKVEQMARAIHSTRYLQKENLHIQLTASFGLATFPEDARDKKELLAAADRCLFQSKTQGKDRINIAGIHQCEPAAA